MIILEMEICTCVPNLIEIGQLGRLRYGDKAIFKMAAVRHVDFAKIAILVT